MYVEWLCDPGLAWRMAGKKTKKKKKERATAALTCFGFVFLFVILYSIYNPLHAARRAMAAAGFSQ